MGAFLPYMAISELAISQSKHLPQRNGDMKKIRLLSTARSPLHHSLHSLIVDTFVLLCAQSCVGMIVCPALFNIILEIILHHFAPGEVVRDGWCPALLRCWQEKAATAASFCKFRLLIYADVSYHHSIREKPESPESPRAVPFYNLQLSSPAFN